MLPLTAIPPGRAHLQLRWPFYRFNASLINCNVQGLSNKMNQLGTLTPLYMLGFSPHHCHTISVHIRRIHWTEKNWNHFQTNNNAKFLWRTANLPSLQWPWVSTHHLPLPPNYQVIQHRVAVLAIANLVRSINRKSIDWSCHLSQLVIQTILDQYMQDASFLLILRGKFKVSKKFPSKKKMLGTKVTPKGMCELISSI